MCAELFLTKVEIILYEYGSQSMEGSKYQAFDRSSHPSSQAHSHMPFATPVGAEVVWNKVQRWQRLELALPSEMRYSIRERESVMVASHFSSNVCSILQLQRHISVTSSFVIGGAVLRDGYCWIDVQSLRPRLAVRHVKNRESTGLTNLEMILNPDIVNIFHAVYHGASGEGK